MGDQTEVCSLSRGVISQPLSEPLQPGVRFLRPPVPAPLSALLAVGFPRLGERYGLAKFRQNNRIGLGPLFPPVALIVHDGGAAQPPCPLRRPFLARAYQHLWLLLPNGVYQGFACAGHTVHPGSSLPRCWRIHPPLAARASVPVTVDALSEGSTRVVASPRHLLGYCRWNSRSCLAYLLLSSAAGQLL